MSLVAAADGLPLNRGQPVVLVEVAGRPHGKGRPRFRIAYNRHRQPFALVYTDIETRKYEQALAHEAKRQMGNVAPLEGPLEVRFTAIFEPPESWSGVKRQRAIGGWLRPAVKPDWDNLAKVGDALNGIVWRDDSQIVSGTAEKWYGDTPLLRIEVWPVSTGLL